jgi:hypothetical protein
MEQDSTIISFMDKAKDFFQEKSKVNLYLLLSTLFLACIPYSANFFFSSHNKRLIFEQKDLHYLEFKTDIEKLANGFEILKKITELYSGFLDYHEKVFYEETQNDSYLVKKIFDGRKELGKIEIEISQLKGSYQGITINDKELKEVHNNYLNIIDKFDKSISEYKKVYNVASSEGNMNDLDGFELVDPQLAAEGNALSYGHKVVKENQNKMQLISEKRDLEYFNSKKEKQKFIILRILNFLSLCYILLYLYYFIKEWKLYNKIKAKSVEK